MGILLTGAFGLGVLAYWVIHHRKESKRYSALCAELLTQMEELETIRQDLQSANQHIRQEIERLNVVQSIPKSYKPDLTKPTDGGWLN